MPAIKRSETYLKSIDGNDEKDGVKGWVVPEDQIEEGDDLNGFAQSHGMRQNATKALTAIELCLILHQIVKEEAHTAHLLNQNKQNARTLLQDSGEDDTLTAKP